MNWGEKVYQTAIDANIEEEMEKEYGFDVIFPAYFLLFPRGLYYFCTQKTELSKL